jgi:hypothetical protein
MNRHIRAIAPGALSLLGLLFIVVVIIYYSYYTAQNYTCTMGVSGTAANVTFKGPQAKGFCSSPAGWQYGGNRFYALEQPQGVILCEGQLTLQGSTADYTVRDTGLLDIVGSGLCKWFSEGAPSSQ